MAGTGGVVGAGGVGALAGLGGRGGVSRVASWGCGGAGVPGGAPGDAAGNGNVGRGSAGQGRCLDLGLGRTWRWQRQWRRGAHCRRLRFLRRGRRRGRWRGRRQVGLPIGGGPIGRRRRSSRRRVLPLLLYHHQLDHWGRVDPVVHASARPVGHDQECRQHCRVQGDRSERGPAQHPSRSAFPHHGHNRPAAGAAASHRARPSRAPADIQHSKLAVRRARQGRQANL